MVGYEADADAQSLARGEGSQGGVLRADLEQSHDRIPVLPSIHPDALALQDSTEGTRLAKSVDPIELLGRLVCVHIATWSF
jgi:hypothetical protein